MPLIRVQTAIQSGRKNLKIVTTGISNYISVITADEVYLENNTKNGFVARSVNVSVNSSSSGVNGLDTGSLAINTWYSLWVIYNPNTATVAAISSLSASSPALPAGYTFKARVGWTLTDGSGNKYMLQIIQSGNKAQYVVLTGSNTPNMPIICSGSQGNIVTPTWVGFSVSGFVPPTAGTITISASQYGNNSVITAAPNNNYSALDTVNSPPFISVAPAGVSGSCSTGDMILESTTIYVASQAGGGCALYTFGWLDNL